MRNKVFTVEQLKSWDMSTIERQGRTSYELMERASAAWLKAFYMLCFKEISAASEILLLIGPGNNGGDGWVIARRLLRAGHPLRICIPYGEKGSRDNKKAKQRFIENLNKGEEIHSIIVDKDSLMASDMEAGAIVIDALFGYGQNRKLDKTIVSLLQFVNSQRVFRVALDLPSGLGADTALDKRGFHSELCLSFELPKKSFFFKSSEHLLRSWACVDIGLDEEFYRETHSDYTVFHSSSPPVSLRARKTFSHKGQYGHVLVCGGQRGMTGAVYLAAKAAIKNGAGKVSALVASEIEDNIQVLLPECMLHRGDLQAEEGLKAYQCIVIGPGLGTGAKAMKWLKVILKQTEKKLLLDADALNLLASNRDLLAELGEHCVLTPHPKEMDRLIGTNSGSEEERWEKARDFAKKHKVCLVLKGAYSMIFDPQGHCRVNTTGKPLLATGGSGDVLSGLIGSWLSQGLGTIDAASLAVWQHGRSADMLSEKGSRSAMAGEIIKHLYQVSP